MTLPILIEPIPNGFRAWTGSPLNWTVEGATAEAAAAAIRERYAQLLASGARVVDLEFSIDDQLAKLAAELAANPFLEEWTEAVKEVRRQRDLEDELELSLERASIDRNGHPTPSQFGVEAVQGVCSCSTPILSHSCSTISFQYSKRFAKIEARGMRLASLQ